MHEVSVMSSLIESILQELENHMVREVEEVVVRIGEVTYLGRDQLCFAFEVLSRGTLLEGSSLVIEEERATVRCPACGYEGEPTRIGEGDHFSMPVLTCPSCGKETKLLTGLSCRVVSLRVVEA